MNNSIILKNITQSKVICPLSNIKFPLTVEIKFRPDSATTCTILATDAVATATYMGLAISYNSDGSIEVRFGNGGALSATSRRSYLTAVSAIKVGETKTISVAATSVTAVSVYIDGVAQGLSVSGSATSMASGTNIILGHSMLTSTIYFDGLIDDLRIWNIARTQAAIQSTLNTNISPQESGLIGYWTFNEGHDTIAYDLTSNANNGTLYNTTWLFSNIYLIQQGNNYYSINSTYYDNIAGNFEPLVLSGGLTPNTTDIETYGFVNINSLMSNMIIGSETFKPIDKLFKNFNIKQYTSK